MVKLDQLASMFFPDGFGGDYSNGNPKVCLTTDTHHGVFYELFSNEDDALDNIFEIEEITESTIGDKTRVICCGHEFNAYKQTGTNYSTLDDIKAYAKKSRTFSLYDKDYSFLFPVVVQSGVNGKLVTWVIPTGVHITTVIEGDIRDDIEKLGYNIETESPDWYKIQSEEGITIRELLDTDPREFLGTPLTYRNGESTYTIKFATFDVDAGN